MADGMQTNNAEVQQAVTEALEAQKKKRLQPISMQYLKPSLFL